jgi:DNA-binding NarL/FixJ family response regulator
MISTQYAQEMMISDRDCEIIRLIAEGWNNRKIGDHLGYAESTIRGCVYVLLSRLHLKNRTHLAVYGIQHHLIPLYPHQAESEKDDQ